MYQWVDSKESNLEIDSFDGIDWEETEAVKEFHAPSGTKDHVLEAFRQIDKLPFCNVNIRFSDNEWDFTPVNALPLSFNMKLRFDPGSAYCNDLKKYALSCILRKEMKIRTLSERLLLLQKFFRFFEADGYTNFKTISKTEVKKLFEQRASEVVYTTLCSSKHILLSFARFYVSSIEEIDDKGILKYLQEYDLTLYNAVRNENRAPEIPKEYLGTMLNGVKEIMRDDEEELSSRITAACIILFSQIGFRRGELFTLKPGAVYEVPSPSGHEPLRYLEFMSYKHGRSDNEASKAHTYVNDLAYEAYAFLEKACLPARSRLRSTSLLVYPKQLKKNVTANSFNIRYISFIMFHAKKLGAVNVGDKYPTLITKNAGELIESHWRKNRQASAIEHMDIDLEDTITYPTLRMFRVTVCTTLHRRGVPLSYIQKHMNHLSPDMTESYIRAEKKADEIYSNNVYRAVLGEGTKILGLNGDPFTQKIKDFIAHLKPEIRSDFDELIKSVGNRYPLRSKVGGFCIRCGGIVPCKENDKTDEIYCAFNMCPNRCFVYFFADAAYKDFKNGIRAMNRNWQVGQLRAAEKERNKLRYIAKETLIPELIELKAMIARDGAEAILERHPNLKEIVEDIDTIWEEAQEYGKEKE